MLADDDRTRLLARVRAWFDAPAQVDHCREEAPNGPTPAEAWLLDALPASGRALDVGCGVGRMGRVLVRRGYAAIGTEVSAELLQVANAAGRDQDRALRLQRVGPRRLPFRDAVFDAALACKVSGYLPGREARRQYLRKLRRLLRPGAPLLLTPYVVTPEIVRTDRREAGHRRAAARFPSLESGDAFALGGAGYLHVFTPAQLRRELVAAGLDLVAFGGDRPHGGEGRLRLAVLRKPAARPASRPTGEASAAGGDDAP